MQQFNDIRDPFGQYRQAKADLDLISLIKHSNQDVKTEALIKGCLHRKQLKLYRGKETYFADLQIILERQTNMAPSLLRSSKISVNKQETHVQPQCYDCGRFTPPFKYCPVCSDVHYCSAACQIRSKLSHQKDCKIRFQPSLDSAIKVEVHMGSDLGRDIQIYFQHEIRMSLQMRGEHLIRGIFDFFNGNGKVSIPQGYQIQIKNDHLLCRRVTEPNSLAQSSEPDLSSIEELVKLYESNKFLSPLQLYMLQRGGIFWKKVVQLHNNHVHVIFIFLCCS